MTRDAPLIAILDDEPEIRRLLASALEDAGFRTASFARATEFEAGLRRMTPDACLIDLGLPDRDGLALVHRLATQSGTTVIIISGRAQVQDRVTGLELGADDYVIKPFDPAEVVARIRARLRKPAPDGTDTPMSHAESELLRIFLDSPRRLITRAQMLEQVGGTAGDSFDRAMDVRVSRLRTKLGEDPKNPRLIKTIYGAGYIFLSEVAWG